MHGSYRTGGYIETLKATYTRGEGMMQEVDGKDSSVQQRNNTNNNLTSSTNLMNRTALFRPTYNKETTLQSTDNR